MEEIIGSLHQCLRTAFPPVTLQLMQEAVKDEPDFGVMADIIGLDPVLAASVLKLVNSPYYGLGAEIMDIQRAAVVLGSQEILKLALSISFQKNLRAKEQSDSDRFASWRLIVWGAVASELICERLAPDEAPHAYLCTLLKDLSLQLLYCVMPEQLPYDREGAQLLCYREGQFDEETAAWGTTHCQLTVDMLSAWDIPVPICSAIAHHHDLDRIDEHDPMTRAVILGTKWAEAEIGCGESPFSLLQFDTILRNMLGLSEEESQELRSRCVERFQAMLDTLGISEASHLERFYQHNLPDMQHWYFLGMEVNQASGGLSAVAAVLDRQLKWNFGVERWEAALMRPGGNGFCFFTSTDKKFPTAVSANDTNVLPWQIRSRSISLNSGGVHLGEIRLGSKGLTSKRLERVSVYSRFFSQAYEQYTNKQAVLEYKAHALDMLPVGVARLTPSGRIIEANSTFVLTYAQGISLKNTTIYPLLEESLGLTLEQEWKNFFQTPRRRSISKVFCTTPVPGERGICVYLSANRYSRDGQDEILLLVEDVTDITELERQALRQLDFLSKLVGSMRDIVLTVSNSGVIEYSSYRYNDQSESLSGKNLFEIAKPVGSFTDSWTPAMLADRTTPIEVIIKLGPKTFKSLELVISPLTSQNPAQSRYLLVGRDMTTIHRLEEKLKRQAVYDGLTDLFNHSHFQLLLEREVDRSHRTGRSLGLVFFDLDGFKKINDSEGHQAGDAILHTIGKLLAANTRRGMDFPCRYGGDEFAIVFTEVTDAQLEALSNRIRKIIFDKTGGRVGSSAGIALLATGETAGLLLARADKASYAAKARGGNCTVWAEEAEQTSI